MSKFGGKIGGKKKKMFLTKVKERSPGLFWFLIAFCFFQAVFTLIKLEVTPFFLFGMFSEKVNVPDTVTIYRQKLNGNLLNQKDINKWEWNILTTTIENYDAQLSNNKIDVVDKRIRNKYPGIYYSSIFSSVKKNITNDSSSVNKYPDWYKQKIRQYTSENITNIEVLKENYKVGFNNSSFQLLSSKKILSIE